MESDAEKLFERSRHFIPVKILDWDRDSGQTIEEYRSMVIDLQADNARILQQKARFENKAIELFERMCLSAQVPLQEKFNTLISYYRCLPENASELVRRFLDMIPHLRKTQNFQALVDLLTLIGKNNAFPDFQRCIVAVTLYNNYMFNVCYDVFTDIAFDDLSGSRWRVEACRYLFASDEHHLVTTSQEVLVAIIEDQKIDSEERYGYIASFISTTGISTLTGGKKLSVVYNESFVAGLQTIFFYNLENGVRQRILSGQHLLQMSESVVPKDEKDKIILSILDIANDTLADENTRADAADIVMRLGSDELRNSAREIIREIGMAGMPSSSMCNRGTIMDSTSTVYTDTQNTHTFSDQTLEIMEKLVVDVVTNVDYSEVYDTLVSLVKKYATKDDGKIDNSIKFKAMKALNRVNQDTATFTKYNITLSGLIVIVWCRIDAYDDKETRNELKKRLVEELIDMGDTCSTGHADRFVNVLSGYEFTLKVSWEDQISSNLVGRLNALIRDCEDPDVKDALEVARTELATQEEKDIYDAFVKSGIERLKDEMYEEFVGGNHVSEDDFAKFFQNSVDKLK